jgi:hypothetical protein
VGVARLDQHHHQNRDEESALTMLSALRTPVMAAAARAPAG